MSTREFFLASALLVALLIHVPLRSAAQGTVLLPRSVIAQGAFDGRGATMALRGTVGQFVAGRAQSGGMKGLIGFWYGLRHVLAVSPSSPDRSALRIDALWPMPASDRVLLRISTRQPQALQLSVTDVLGRCLIRKVIFAAPDKADTESLPVASLHPGVYTLTLLGVHGWDASHFVVLR